MRDNGFWRARTLGLVALVTGVVLIAGGCMKVATQRARTYEGGGSIPAESMVIGPHPMAAPGMAESRSPAGPVFRDEEEVWVISRPNEKTDREEKLGPGCGALLTRIDEQEVAVPLKHTDVRAEVTGYIATVGVSQTFQNPYDEKIEAIYLFPLPQNAAVSEFVMTIGERRIRGIIREREEAEEIYAEAKRQGYRASLMTQERANLFRQAVANIEPGRSIEVEVVYFHTLAYDDGWFEFVFPMVVGPRYNPPAIRDGVGAVPRGSTGRSGQRTEVSYLRPRERSGHDISLSLRVDAGMVIEETVCRTHRVEVEEKGKDRFAVRLDAMESIPNRDFVFRYRLAGEGLKSGLITHRDGGEGYFSLMLVPPRLMESRWRQPLELVFVLDCSGSMSGVPIEQSKAAVARALELLEPGDTFQIIRFASESSRMSLRARAASPRNVERARGYLRELKGGGGTQMIAGIKAALEGPRDSERQRYVCFLTDGYIGNEAEILETIHDRLGDTRIFSFGVGSAPNRYLLDRMAGMGHGMVAYLGSRDDGAEVMNRFFDQISHPVLRDLRVDWGGMRVDDVYPREVPDLFSGRPLILAGRFGGRGEQEVRVTGKLGEDRISLGLVADLEAGGPGNRMLPKVWARRKILDLADRTVYSRNRLLPRQIRRLALDYGLMSAYTAFVAVDTSGRTDGRSGVTVPVPVPVPEGVRYETTVGK